MECVRSLLELELRSNRLYNLGKEIPPLWDAATYDWTVRPGSSAMSSIVKDREQVFSKQRKIGTRARLPLVSLHRLS